MAKVKATHRLTRPHGVLFDPAYHFLKGEKPPRGARVTLPAGTHCIPTEGQLQNLPDRFQALSSPEPPEERDDPTPEDEDEASSDVEDEDEPDVAVDAALADVGGEWDALTTGQLAELAEGYALTVRGSGSGGNVLKADWIAAVQGARGATG